jgi:DNA modification methylase
VLPLEADAVVTDPPYGMDWNTDHSRFTQGQNGTGGKHTRVDKRIEGDAEDFDPTHLLQYERVIIWGMQHFPNRLQRGSVLVWVKKYPDAYGTFLSDADLAWMKGGCGVYVSKVMHPAKHQSEKCHPTQKPVPLMAWCIEKTKLPKGSTILDPYMGSGTTGLAAIRLGMNFIGIERDAAHYKTACERIRHELDGALL